MTYCCWLSKGGFSPYLAYYSRDFNCSISKSPEGEKKKKKKKAQFLTISAIYQNYSDIVEGHETHAL